MSSARSRSGGSRSGTTFRRKNRSSRNSPLLDRDAQVLVGRGDDAHVDLDRDAAADRRVLALLEHAQQLRLRLHRHVADLVEEERAAVGLLEPAGAAGHRAGEGALLVAEELGLDQLARDRRQLTATNGPERRAPVVVQRAGHELLAGAGLARDHDREVGRHQPGERPVDLLHRGRAADERDLLVLGGAVHVRGAARPRQRPPDDRDQLLEVERLRQVFVGAALGGADRGHESVLRAHDDDRQLRPHPLDARQEVEGVLVRHHDVGDDEIALALARPSARASRRWRSSAPRSRRAKAPG